MTTLKPYSACRDSGVDADIDTFEEETEGLLEEILVGVEA